MNAASLGSLVKEFNNDAWALQKRTGDAELKRALEAPARRTHSVLRALLHITETPFLGVEMVEVIEIIRAGNCHEDRINPSIRDRVDCIKEAGRVISLYAAIHGMPQMTDGYIPVFNWDNVPLDDTVTA